MPPDSLDLSILITRSALKRILSITVIGAIVGGGYALLAPKWYRSVLTVVPAKSQKPGISSMVGTELAALAVGFDSSTGAAPDVQRIAAVLQSVAVTDAVIQKFELSTRYRQKYQESTREALWAHCEVKALPKPGLVQL